MNSRLSKKLLELFEQRAKQIHPEKFKLGPSKEEILEFTQEHGIVLRDDHLQFLMKYGGGLIETYYGTNSFEDFKDYYLETDEKQIELDNKETTPPGSTYFSYIPCGDGVAINNEKGHIGYFYGGDGLDNVNYGNIDSVLFHYYIECYKYFKIFKSVDSNLLSKETIENYKTKYQSYKIEDIYITGLDFYYVDGNLISLTQHTYTKYSGGILDLI
ncbi:SMI1/KNR4 family protein [Acinetobacter pollinis]|uniref:SMI1/KNR4 family protein n=1 Tax=Acinetobacter pollinis TaxID=2605270 RepID=UPI0018A2C6F0|nr:SMI1/KNR4 family protein [Acinetobacter pollinis]MBF7691579.1 SMI1/KNR4 family protein [Acinetobacter pollinis]MBF7699060.1 SMI1/KNR4 family protein [Acinetobacter pollinis]